MMNKESKKISLSQAQRESLERIVRKHSSPQTKVIRAKIILLADEGHGIRKTARRLNISPRYRVGIDVGI
jgi:DNA-binding CsgD family transcriptional regulator